MAEEIQIQGSGQVGKVRNPLGVIGLSFITLGIYAIVWYYKTNKELAEIGKARGTDECGDSPGTSVIAITLGALVIVPAFISIYNFCKRLSAGERHTAAPQGMEAGLLFVLWIFLSPVALYIAQSNLNKVLQAQATGGGPPLQAPPQQPAAGPEAPVQQPPPQPGS
jgi:drug/metabolite transporter (DMT)-like permease